MTDRLDTAVPARSRRRLVDRTGFRLFVTVFLVYAVHFASNVVRESYLAISLGEALSIRVDDYVGLHPDIFVMEGRGAYINNNPGASMLGAIPYAVAHPLIEGLLRLKPELARPKPATTYDDERPNRERFMNRARARGLDIKLGLAAASMHVGLMAPLGALAAVAVFAFLRTRLRDERKALWLALLYAFGTPIFFRSAFLNQNVLIAHAVLFAYLLAAGLVDPASASDRARAWRLRAIGALMGIAVLCDYTGVPLAVVFGSWVILVAWRQGGLTSAASATTHFATGAAGPLLVLLGYQWLAFGNPWLPAQTYMPATAYSVRGWNGFFWPSPELLWRNLFDLRYGLIAFSPMLALAVAAPFIKHRVGAPGRSELWLIFGTTAALYLFISSVQFALLQWNTGVRYIVPAVPLLFMALVPVLLALPRWAAALVIVPTVTISWCVSMAREDVPTSLMHIFLRGFELPWLSVLRKTASGYLPFLEEGASPLPLFVLLGFVIWLLWRGNATAPRASGRVP